MINRDHLNAVWKGSIGIGVRALVGFEDSCGTWLLFEETIKASGMIPERLDKLTCGDVARLMLIHKLNYLETLDYRCEADKL